MDKENKNEYDVVIVGAGVTGTALLFTLAKYSNLERIALVEKHSGIAEVNSSPDSNSQTLHFGDIETNYTLEKATAVNEASELLAGYIENFASESAVKGKKMVLAVGKEEIQELERRYEEFHELFPKLKKLDREGIARLEPNVIKGRDPKEELLALSTEDGYAVNYKSISESFVKKARETGKQVDVFLGEKVIEIGRENSHWEITTPERRISARLAVVSSGPHSLLFARSLGYGKEFGILPVAGNFYRAGKVLNGKVYMMQIKKLPFAAVHGDPNVNDLNEARFGPTAKVLPMLERHNYETVYDFLKTSVFTFAGVFSLWKIITDKIIFMYVLKNIAYDLPFIGKRLFLKQVQKIIPTLTSKDITFGKGLGGIRPQVVNTKTKKMEMGEAKIVGENIIFNITPSPGASVCLKTAQKDTAIIAKFLGSDFQFDEERFKKDLTRPKTS